MSDSQIVPGSKYVSGNVTPPDTFRTSSGLFSPGFSADPGTPVTIFDAVTPSKADAAATANVAGLCVSAGEEGGDVFVKYAGPLTLDEAIWNLRTEEGAGGLTPHAYYYLSAAHAGKITITKPVSGFVTPVGFAWNTRTLQIQIGAPVAAG